MMDSRIVISKNETQLKLRAGYACAIHDIDNNDNISTRYVFFKFTFYITQTAIKINFMREKKIQFPPPP